LRVGAHLARMGGVVLSHAVDSMYRKQRVAPVDGNAGSRNLEEYVHVRPFTPWKAAYGHANIRPAQPQLPAVPRGQHGVAARPVGLPRRARLVRMAAHGVGAVGRRSRLYAVLPDPAVRTVVWCPRGPLRPQA